MTDLYVSTQGNDSSTGRSDDPLRTIAQAVLRQQNGQSIIIDDGAYEEESPILIQGITQGRLRALNKGLVDLHVPAISLSGTGIITLDQCNNYVVDGIHIVPPETFSVPSGTWSDPTNASLIRVVEGTGNLITDMKFESWAIDGRLVHTTIHPVSSVNSDYLRINRCEVLGVDASFTVSDNVLTSGGLIYGISVVNPKSCMISDCKVRGLNAVNANIGGIFTTMTDADVRSRFFVDRCLVEDLLTTGETGEPQNHVIGIGTMGSLGEMLLTIRKSRVHALGAVHAEPEKDTNNSIGCVAWGCKTSVVQNVLVYNAGVGLSAVLVGLDSVWEGITTDTVTQSIAVSPVGDDPLKVRVRNLSMSNVLEDGIVTSGRAFVDIDFLNTYKVQGQPFRHLDGGPFQAHITLPTHWTEANPRYVSPDNTDRNFELEYISPLINRGGEV